MTAITDPSMIALFRLKVLASRLELELKGIRFKGRPTATIVRREFGWFGNRRTVLAKLKNHIREQEAKLDRTRA